MGKTFQKPEALADTITHYCPGCTHGVAHRLVAEVIDELGVVLVVLDSDLLDFIPHTRIHGLKSAFLRHDRANDDGLLVSHYHSFLFLAGKICQAQHRC